MRLIGLLSLVTFFFNVFPNNVYAQGNSLLWEISGNGLKESSFLYGTIHVRDERVFKFDSLVFNRINECSMLTGELALDSSEISMMLIFKMMMPNDDSLKNYLSEEKHGVVMDALQERLGMVAMVAERMKPIFVSMLYTQMEDTVGAGKEVVVLDDFFQRYAKGKGMTVKGLETIDEQLDAIDAIPIKDQAQLLYETIVPDEEDELQNLDDMVDLYIQQDLNKLKDVVSEADDITNFSQELLVERNKRMTERMIVLMREQRVFNTMGAAHLSGEFGVIGLLQELGFVVEPIAFSFHE